MNNNSQNSSTTMKNVCPVFQFSGLLIFNNFFTLIFTSSTLYLSVILFQLLYKKYGLYHVNVRLLLLHFCVANGATSICMMFRILYNFLLLIFGMDIMQMKRMECMGLDVVYNVCNTVSLMAISAVGFERFVATLSHRYTDPEHITKVFRFVAASLWFGAIINCCFGFWNISVYDDGSTMCYCIGGAAPSYGYVIVVLAMFIFTQISTFVCFGYVQIKNKQVFKDLSNISKYTLPERYQMSNNISTTFSLLPNVISNAVLYTFVCTVYYFLWTPYWNGRVEFVVHLLSGINDLISITCFLQTVLLLKFNKNLSSVLVKEYKLFKLWKRLISNGNNDLKLIKPSNNLNVVSFRVSPDKSKEILDQMWTKVPSRKP